MRAGAALLAAPAAFVAAAAFAQAPADLDLYAGTFPEGLHGHPVGSEGQRLRLAERALERRRAALREWLVRRHGEAAVGAIEQRIEDDLSSVYFVRAMTPEEEWVQIRRARRRMQTLERRMRATGED